MTEILDAGAKPPVGQGDRPPPPPLRERLLATARQVPPQAWVIAGAVAFVSLLAVSIWFLFVRTTPQEATIVGKSWERKTEVERFRVVREEAWSHPSDAYDIDSFRAIHHYDRVLIGYSTYECGTTKAPRTCDTPIYVDVPVYRTRYRYSINRWMTDSWLVAKGTGDTPETWASIPPTFVDLAVLGNQREGNEHPETYQLHIVCADDCDDTLKVRQAQFDSLHEGQTITASVTATGNVRSVNLP